MRRTEARILHYADHMAGATDGAVPLLFSETAAVQPSQRPNDNGWVMGGPADRPQAEWTYTAYQGVSAERRRLAQDILDAEQAAGRAGRLMVFEGYIGVRSPLGFFLLARDDRGWYVTALATEVPGRPMPLRVFDQLIRAVEWLGTQAAARGRSRAS